MNCFPAPYGTVRQKRLLRMFRLLSKTNHPSVFATYRTTRNRWWSEGECHRFLSRIEKERNNATTTSRTVVQSVNDFRPYAQSAGIFLGILGAATAGAAAIYGKFSYLNSEVQKERELRQEQVQKERELRQSEVQKERELRQSEVQRVRAEMASEVEKAREETTARFLLYGYAEEFQRYQKTAGVYKDANDEENNETATSENTK